MKNLRILPLILLILFLFRCDLIDKIKGLEEVEVNLELIKTIPVAISAEDPNKVNETFTIDAKSNPDIMDFLSDITEYDIWAIYVNFSEYKGEPGILFEGTLKIGPFTANFTGMDAIEPSLYLKDNGGAIYLDLNQAALEAINSALLAGHKLDCSIVGTVSDQPVSFIINIYVEGIVYAEVSA